MNNDIEYNLEEEEEITRVWDWREILTAKELELIDNPPAHWATEKASLPLRLIGVYAVGPDSGIMTANDKPEFGWRGMVFSDRRPTPIMFEASARITELEAELELYKGLVGY